MATHPYLDVAGPVGFAHRGGAAAAPENTLEAFEAAYEIGYRYLETDAHLTRDGVVVAFHDTTLDRVTDIRGAIAEHDWATVARARVEGHGTVPALADLLTRFPEARLNIDAKSDAVLEPLLDLVGEHDAFDRICLGSFSDRRLSRARRIGGHRLCTSAGPLEVTRHVLRSRRLRIPASRAHALQVPVRIRGVKIVTQRFVEQAHIDGLAVHVWTIDDVDEMHRLFDLGVDGIMTDLPEVLRDAMSQRGIW